MRRTLLASMSLVALTLLVLVAAPSEAQVLTVLHDFTGGNDGRYPVSTLTLGTDGNFYGVTYGETGSSVFFGSIFQMTPSGSLTTLHTFQSQAGGGLHDGAHPRGRLLQGGDGNFYGTTEQGGAGIGTVFSITPSGALTILHSFLGFADGGSPQDGLVSGGDGYFYGTTQYQGSSGVGIVFRTTPAGALTTPLFRPMSDSGLLLLLFSAPAGGISTERPLPGAVADSTGSCTGSRRQDLSRPWPHSMRARDMHPHPDSYWRPTEISTARRRSEHPGSRRAGRFSGSLHPAR